MPGQVTALVGQILRQSLHRLWSGRYLGRVSNQREALLAASRAHERLAEVYYFTSETALSLFAALRTLNLAEAAGPSPELARGYAAVGALLGFIPLHRTARAYLARALGAAQDAGHLTAQGFVSLAVGFYYAGVGNWARAQQRFEKVVEVSELLGDRRRRDDGLSNLLYVSYFQGDFGSGVTVADDLIESATRRTDPHMHAAGLQGKANCLLHLGETDEAMACLDKSQSLLAEDTGILGESLRIELYGLLSLAYLRRGQYQQALDIAEQLVGLTASSFPSNYGTLPGYANPAKVYLTLWETNHPQPDLDDLARKTCKAMHGFARVFPIGQPRALLCQGLVEWLDGRPTKAIRAWQESLAAAEQLSMLYDQGLSHYEIGRHLDRDDPTRAAHLTRACELFEELGAIHNLAQAGRELIANV
jgi:tetratricopeptide (TPR) repeat protein